MKKRVLCTIAIVLMTVTAAAPSFAGRLNLINNMPAVGTAIGGGGMPKAPVLSWTGSLIGCYPSSLAICG